MACAASGSTAVIKVRFQFDSTTDGSPIKIGSIIDEHTRECLCLGGLVERNITGEDLITELDRLAAQRGYYCSRRSGLAGFGVSALVRAVTAALFRVCDDNRIRRGRRGS